MLRIMLTLSVCLALCGSLVAAVPTISAVGSKFFTSDGNQFFVKGRSFFMHVGSPSADTTLPL
jgi:1,3-beta-glucanosyltransferase GAS1